MSTYFFLHLFWTCKLKLYANEGPENEAQCTSPSRLRHAPQPQPVAPCAPAPPPGTVLLWQPPRRPQVCQHGLQAKALIALQSRAKTVTIDVGGVGADLVRQEGRQPLLKAALQAGKAVRGGDQEFRAARSEMGPLRLVHCSKQASEAQQGGAERLPHRLLRLRLQPEQRHELHTDTQGDRL